MAVELMGKTRFDMALTLIKDMWFLMGHISIQTVFLMLDKRCIEFWKERTPKDLSHTSYGKGI